MNSGPIASGHYTGPGWSITCGDALRFLSESPGLSVDCVITDPPYSSGGATRGDRSAGTGTKYVRSDAKRVLPDFVGDNRDQRGFLAWCSVWLMAAWLRTKPGGVLLVFCDWRQLPTMTDAVQCGGWVWRGIVPWNKGEGSRPQQGRPRAQCEYVVFATKGPHVAYDGAPCLPGFFEKTPPRERIHMSEKPVGLIEDLALLCPPGGVVLDPFAGSGAHAEGVLRAGRRYVGVELVPEIAREAAARVRAYQEHTSIHDENAGQVGLFSGRT